MAIDMIKGAAMTYGSASQSTDKQAVDGKDDTSQQQIVAQVVKDHAAVQPYHTDSKALNNQKDQEASKQNAQIQKAVDNIKKGIPHTEAIFGIHEGTNRVMIKIVDKDTKQVIKEYPAEKTLDMIEKVWEMAGIMVDEKR